MHISFDVRWMAGRGSREEIDPDLFRLLEAVRADGSLVRAAESVSVSYRHAWGLLRRWENRFHLPLVEMRRGRGHGTRLSELGDKLLLERDKLHERVHGELQEIGEQISRDIAGLGRAGTERIIRVTASHGMAIAQLADVLRGGGELKVQLQTRGSIESLKLLARSECSMAGFHFPQETLIRALAPLYQPWLRQDRVTLLLVATRAQGLMTRKDNPKGIGTLEDLTRPAVRFVNRQPESGTRVIFDGLLHQHRIEARRIMGYQKEEFTHLAVAAMIASGAADAGFGIEAAAAQFQLRFVPILREGYYIALPRESMELKAMVQQALQSAAFREPMRAVAGYDAGGAGQELDPAGILRPR